MPLLGHSVQLLSCVMSDSLWPHGLQHTRPPCPSPTPGVYPHPCPLSQWRHPTISSSVIPFSSCLQSFPASGSFPMSPYILPLFRNPGQSTALILGVCWFWLFPSSQLPIWELLVVHTVPSLGQFTVNISVMAVVMKYTRLFVLFCMDKGYC